MITCGFTAVKTAETLSKRCIFVKFISILEISLFKRNEV